MYIIYIYINIKKLLLPGVVYGIFSAVFKNGKVKLNSTRFAHLNLKGSGPVNNISHKHLGSFSFNDHYYYAEK